MTVKLFHEDVYLTECYSQIVDIHNNDDDQFIILDQTIFSPRAGGQPGDQGTIGGCDVKRVIEKDGVIYHQVASIPATKQVHCQIDWAHRLDMMQNHCGEHILSGIFFSEYGAANKGFHMSSDTVTMDIDMQNIDHEIIERVENLANNAVYNNYPIHTTFLDSKDEADKYSLRKSLNVSEDIKIITIEKTDCIACCGTHPSYTGEVGIIKITKYEKYKGMTRIYFKCGQRALRDYQFKHEIATELYRMYSGNSSNIIDKIKKEEEKNKSIRKELTDYKNSISKLEAEKIGMLEKDFIVLRYQDYGTDVLQNIIKRTLNNSSKILVLVSDSHNAVVLAHNMPSSDIQFGQLVKKYAINLGGKGGGSNTSAQVGFNDKASMDAFCDIIVGVLSNSNPNI